MAIKLGTAFGVPIFIDYSWFIIFLLIVYTVGFGLMPGSYPNLSWIEYLSIGVLSAIVMFASIVVHELAHSIVAKNSGLQIAKITLFLFGGASEMEGEPSEPNIELKMAAAGPITSVTIGLFSGALLDLLYQPESSGPSPSSAILCVLCQRDSRRLQSDSRISHGRWSDTQVSLMETQ